MRRYSYKTRKYGRLMGENCANPSCRSGFNIETHHIVPLITGGKDEYWNMIRLCQDCHRHNFFHSQPDEMDLELFTWKCSQELNYLGYILDDRVDDFVNKPVSYIKQALNIVTVKPDLTIISFWFRNRNIRRKRPISP